MIRIAALVAAIALPAGAEEPPKQFAIAGLRVGMPQTAAKAAGLANCHIGTGYPESTGSIFCTATQPANIAGLKATSVTAEFKGPKHNTLTELRIQLSTDPTSASSAFRRSWGPPVAGEDDLFWSDGPAELKLYMSSRRLPTHVTITFNLERGRLARKAAAQERAEAAKNAAALKAFK